MTPLLGTSHARIGDFLRALSSAAGLPGSGAAGAIAIGLAAACAAKAAAVTLKHCPAHAGLMRAHQALISAIDQALAGSDEDSVEFASFLRQRTAESAERVLVADEDLLRLIAEVLKILDELEPQIRSNVTADLHAARVLSDAARAIQTENIRELRQRLHA